jgi:hypothetical protein
VNDWLAWSREPLANGGVVLTAPAGPAAGSICIRPRVRPRPLRAIVQSLARQGGVDAAHARGPIERIVTDDGEHAALVELEMPRASWVVGIVAGEDALTLVEGTGARAAAAAIREAVVRMLRATALGIAPQRARMFEYPPPAGWYGVRRTLATCWLAPRGGGRIVVCDAVPATGSARLTQDLLWTIGAPAHAEVEPIAGRVRGRRTRWTSAGGTLAQIELADARFLYRVYAHARGGADLAALAELVDGIVPVPAPAQRAVSPNSEAFAWMT